MSEIPPFAIEASHAQLEDLEKRLAMTRWPDKETPGDCSQGIPLEYMKQIHEYWRPQTLGYGIADSPVGQAAWMLERFYQWMDCHGHPENIVTRD